MLTLTFATMILIVPALKLMLTGSPWQFALGQVLMALPPAWRSGCRAPWWSRSFHCVRV